MVRCVLGKDGEKCETVFEEVCWLILLKIWKIFHTLIVEIEATLNNRPFMTRVGSRIPTPYPSRLDL